MKVKRFRVDEIQIKEGRQRKDLGDLSELETSLQTHKQIHPIVVNIVEGVIWLVAGERRLTAAKNLGWEFIYASEKKDLTQEEAEVLELDENIKRKDLHWVEWAFAVQRIHAIQCKNNSSWNQERTMEYLGYAKDVKSIRYAIALEGKLDDKLAKAPTLESAYNAVARVQQRALADVANHLLGGGGALPKVQGKVDGGTVIDGTAGGEGASPLRVVPQVVAPEAVYTGSFLDWAPLYAGPKFNFIHCDFPYGIDIGESDQMSHDTNKLYEDTPEVYWALLQAFAENLDKFCYPSAHLMFWFSPEFYIETYDFLTKNTNFKMLKRPLIWHKTDNAGVCPDHRRRPRNTYEMALMGTRDDRFILEPVAASYGAPTASKKLHPSEKPEPVLKHFFRMFVNADSAVFDPTAGGGSALRAADEMGAARVMGLELDPEYANAANGALRRARSLREASARASSIA